MKCIKQRYGYEPLVVTAFENVIEKIKKAQAHLILLDINLPLYDGYYICREIRKDLTTPIIIVTSRDSEMDELMSMNLGADDFVTKSHTIHKFPQRVLQPLLRELMQLTKRLWPLETSRLTFQKGLF